MKKYLIPGLAGTSLILAVALAYTLGANTDRYGFDENQAVVAHQEWNTQMMSNGRFDSNDRGNMMTTENSHDIQFTTADYSLDGYSVSMDELESMMTVLINDEYKARAEYEAIIDEFGEQAPFTNLVRAETNHINALANLFENYGLEVPEDNGASVAVVPDTLQEAYEIGVEAEIANAALYEEYLSQDLPNAVETVFTNLMNASAEKHLPTFEAYASGDISSLSSQHGSSMGGHGRR